MVATVQRERAPAVDVGREDRDAEFTVARVNPALRGHFELLLIPRRIPVRGPLKGAELYLIRCLRTANREWEGNLEHRMPLLPVDSGHEIDSVGAGGHEDILLDNAVAVHAAHPNSSADRAGFENGDRRFSFERIVTLVYRFVDIPRVFALGTILQ